jgi:integrase/recombinase XerC
MYCSCCISVYGQDQQLIDGFCGRLPSLRGFSDATALAYRKDLEQWASYLLNRGISLPEVRVGDFRSYLLTLTVRRSNRTAIRKLHAFRAFYGWLLKSEMISQDPTTFVRLKKNWTNKPRFRSVEDVRDILDRARRLALGPHRSERTRQLAIRDWAIMEFLYGSGARRKECCGIDLFNLNTEDRTVTVHGKGNKDRKIAITEAAVEVLRIYKRDARGGLLRRRPKGEPASRALFLTKSGTRLCPENINKATKGMTPHQFRHSYAQHSVDAGASLAHVQQQLGHAKIQTTAIYAGYVPFDELKKAHKRFHPRARKHDGEKSQNKERQG